MDWVHQGNKLLSEPMMVSLPMHICFTWPQWVKHNHSLTLVIKELTLLFTVDGETIIMEYSQGSNACSQRRRSISGSATTQVRLICGQTIGAPQIIPRWAENEFRNIVICMCISMLLSVGLLPGGRLNVKMSFYQYRDPHVKDKTVSRPSYL